MRIAVIAPQDFESSGGSFSYVNTMVESLLDSYTEYNHDFTLFTLGYSVSNDPTAKSNFDFKRIPKRGKLLLIRLILKELLHPGIQWDLKVRRIFRRRSNLRRTLEIEGYDFVWFVAPSGEVIDLPFATTLWDLEFRAQPFFPEVSTGGEWEKRQNLNAQILQRAALVIVGTDFGAQQAMHFFGVARERILVAPLSIQSKIDTDCVLRDPDLVFYPAQFWPHKNHVTLIKAFGLAREISGRNLRLVLPGSDKGNQRLIQKYVESIGLQEFVDFPGFISQSELVHLYRTASLMVFPSLFGPDNLPPLEAIAHGCPALVADIPGAREQLGSSVSYFEPFSELKLAEQMLLQLETSSGNLAGHLAKPRESLEAILKRVGEFECYIRTWKFLPLRP
jgi:glycosyltransferase involved in cell wall biosynthesis